MCIIHHYLKKKHTHSFPKENIIDTDLSLGDTRIGLSDKK